MLVSAILMESENSFRYRLKETSCVSGVLKIIRPYLYPGTNSLKVIFISAAKWTVWKLSDLNLYIL